MRKICKICHSKFNSVRNQKRCPSCVEKKETLAIQERMLRESKKYPHTNKCKTCGNFFGAYSGYTKWCSYCIEKKRLKAQGKKLNPIKIAVKCKCGEIIEFYSNSTNHRHFCPKCCALKKRYPPEFNNKLKAKIRKKFNHTCQLCGKFAKVPHHIDYNKNNNCENNFILLCTTCNFKVNKNRVQWEIFFNRYLIEFKGKEIHLN